jgi:hypothetical protein
VKSVVRHKSRYEPKARGEIFTKSRYAVLAAAGNLHKETRYAVLAAAGNLHKLLRYGLGLLALLVFAGSYAYADGDAFLHICNKGSVGINVVVAIRDSFWPLIKSWEVSGWTNIDPGDCKLVYGKNARERGEPAYIGFGFLDSQNHWTAGHIEQAPDLGWNGFTKVLIRSDKRLCVRSQGMAYKIRNDPAVDCASFHSGGNDPGGYVPLASALYFVPNVSECHSVGFIGQVSCTGGDYYLNVKPTSSDRELHASAGSESGKDQPPAEPSIGDAILQKLAKAAAEKPAAPFVAACNAWYSDPANGRFRPRDPTAYCSCLGAQYQFLMTPEQVSFYAAAFDQRFRREIAQPAGHSTDPAWPRLHPAAERCAQ